MLQGSLGDTVAALPALRAIVRFIGNPSRFIVVHDRSAAGLAGPQEILPDTLGIRKFIEYSAGRGIWSAIKLLKHLRAERIGAAVFIGPSERDEMQVRRDRLFFRLAGARTLIGFRAFRSDEQYPRGPDGRLVRVRHEASFRLERLRRDGVLIDEAAELAVPFLRVSGNAKEEATRWLAANRKYPNRPLVAICPGAKQPANVWPLERFRELGARLVADGRCEVVVVGGLAEQEAGASLVGSWRDGLSAAGSLSPLASASLLHRCGLVIGLDTGTTHLAAAGGAVCIAIYGARENPGRWYPLGVGHKVFRYDPPCAGCRASICPIPEHPCIRAHTVEAVWNEVVTRLQLPIASG